MESNKKRKSESNENECRAKKSKQWMLHKKGKSGYIAPSIEPGDAGIWITCVMGKEGKCTAEIRDLFEQYAAKLYGETNYNADEANRDDDNEVDIEAEISKEVQGLKSKSQSKCALFQTVKTDIQCVLFFKTRPPIEPVEFVHRICKDALEGTTKKCRWVKRLTPMTMMGKATPEGLEKVAESVLQPVFHSEHVEPKTFAVRSTRRNHNVMKRDDIIRQIARVVGSKHSVDLKNYDRLILVDVYRNVLGMSVVGSDFEELKQFNLAEIYDPTPKPSTDRVQSLSSNTGNGNLTPTTMPVKDEQVQEAADPANNNRDLGDGKPPVEHNGQT
ncbi:hypothetical protein ACLMJK_000125 [Lecanora helva]